MDKDLLNYFNGDELAASTWQNKYALRDNDGNFIEKSPIEMHRRLAKEFWRVEKEFISSSKVSDKSLLSEYGQLREDLTEDKILELFNHFKYIVPAGSVMSGAGSGKPISLSNCFVLPTMPEDSYSSIMQSRGEMVQLEKRRGGCIEENTNVIIKDKGIIPIKEVKVGDFILSFNPNTRCDEWRKVLDWYYTEVKLEDQIEIQTDHGEFIKTSKKHPLLVVKDSGYTYENYNSGNLYTGILKTSEKFQEYSIPEDQDLIDLGWMIGMHFGDGTVDKNYRIRILGDNENIIKVYASILNKETGSNRNYNKSNRKNYRSDVWEFSLKNSSTEPFVKKYFDDTTGQKTYTWTIPSFIKNNDLMLPFLAGLIDSDGYITASGRIDINTCSERGAREICEFLASVGEPYSVSRKESKRPNEHVQWCIRIPNYAKIYSDLKTIMKHEKKIARMDSTRRSHSGSYFLTSDETSNMKNWFFNQFTRTEKRRYENLKSNKNNSIRNKKSGICSLKLFKESGYLSEKKYNEITSRRYVKTITEDNQIKRSYIDIEVEGNNNYYAGEFGFINIHNCGCDLSKLRPAGAFVNNAAKTSTGAASFMEGFSAINNEVAQCIEGNQELLTKTGLVKIKDIKIGDEVFTKKGFIKVIGKFDKGNKDIILLTTKHGAKLKATEDHIIMVFSENSEPINKKISELKIGDQLSTLVDFKNKTILPGGLTESTDYIENVVPAGNAHVYDIELESENMFWCEGVYVHNCGRRGALMLTISILHPDSPEFIEKKQDLTKVTGANVSVKIPDEFMKAVEEDKDFILRWPIDSKITSEFIPEISKAEYWVLNKYKGVYYKKIRAKELWERLIHCAWNTAEPGILFESQLHNWAPDGVYPKFKAISTNPCVTGDTLIDGLGFKRSVRDLLDKGDWAGLKVKSYNLTSGKVEYKELLNIQLTKRKAEVLALKISSDGVNFHIIKLTPDHKVYTVTRNYVEAKDLTKDDVFYVEDTKKAMLYEKVKLSVLEDVYDLTVKDNHNFYANGVLIKNCGEIPMSSDSCRLIHCNLTSFVDNPYLENAAVNYDRAYKVFYEATRLGDDLVELEIEAVNRILNLVSGDEFEKVTWQKLLDMALEGRRAGVGFFGLSDLIAELNIKFCSPESIEITDHLCKVMMRAELDAEVDMAIERGCFPGYDKNIEVPGANKWYDFVEETYPEQWERMQKYGRRNVSFSTIAPTGSVAMVARASSGIEPVFMPLYTRRRKCNSEDEHYDFVDKLGVKFQEFVVVHPGLENWAKIKYPNEDTKNWKIKQWEEVFKVSPWNGSTSPEIDWEKRVELQGVVQKYITHAISSTVNLPNSVTEEEISKIYLTAWKTGNKGQTVYRDGCRDGVLISVNEKKKDEKFRSYVEAPKRPKVLEADFHTTRVKGEVFYVMVGLYLDKPYEVFVYKPELREGEKPPKQHRGEIIKIKKGVYTFKSDTLTIENISKDLSPLEYTVVLFSSMLLRTGANLKYVLKTAQKAKDGINGFVSALVRILSKYSPEELLKGEVCPECGNDLTREGGCIICKNCGYSKCL